jgi:hypothetical protein
MAGNTLNTHVGPTFSSVGAQGGYDGRQEEHGAAVMQQASGKYTEATKRGGVYSAFGTGLTPTTALNGTAVPLVLYNPVGSGKRLKVLKVGVAQAATGTLGTGAWFHGAITINGPTGSQGNTVPTGSSVTPVNMDIGAANASVATVLTTATIVAGKALYPFLQQAESVGGTTTSGSMVPCYEDVDGNIILEPGAGYVPLTISAAGSSPLVDIGVVWEEESLAS